MEDLIAIRLLSLIVIIIKMTFCSINFELDRRRHTKNKYCYGLCNLQRLSQLNVSFYLFKCYNDSGAIVWFMCVYVSLKRI